MLVENQVQILYKSQDLKDYLNIKHLLFCTNGTVALQLAINSLQLNKEIITTPFSYVATVNSILWEKCTPVFVDINAKNFCIDAYKIEEKITPKTKAIIVVHLFGQPAEMSPILKIARKYKLKILKEKL
jgi:dTDP-4-amino-4,6-dideoxygalactose transaminase